MNKKIKKSGTKKMKLTAYQILLLNFVIGIFEALIMVTIIGLTSNLSITDWHWSGLFISIFTSTQTLIITIKIAITSGKEPVLNPFDDKV